MSKAVDPSDVLGRLAHAVEERRQSEIVDECYAEYVIRNALRTLSTIAVLGAMLTSCASLARRDGLRDAHLERLYFGRNIGDTAVVSDSAWGRFIREVVTPNFPEGATVWDAAGQWRGPDGTLIRERSFVVELLHLVTPEVEQRVQTVIDEYKHRFAQQSVLRMVTNVRASF